MVSKFNDCDECETIITPNYGAVRLNALSSKSDQLRHRVLFVPRIDPVQFTLSPKFDTAAMPVNEAFTALNGPRLASRFESVEFLPSRKVSVPATFHSSMHISSMMRSKRSSLVSMVVSHGRGTHLGNAPIVWLVQQRELPVQYIPELPVSPSSRWYSSTVQLAREKLVPAPGITQQ